MRASGGRLVVGVPRERLSGERRVALTPAALAAFAECQVEIVVEAGAGQEAGFSDEEFAKHGASVGRREQAFSADVVLQVRSAGMEQRGAGQPDGIDLLRPGQVVIGLSDPLGRPECMRQLAERGVVHLAMDLVPRITRAQGMDALSSQATVAGYKAVTLAAATLPKMFPMLTTAAGTVPPARVLVIGAGVAGLQAIATARRLGAAVEAYDVRPTAREQIRSLGAKVVDLGLEEDELEEDKAGGGGGYAREMEDDFYRRQRELLGRAVAASDVVVTTAAVPGRRAPVLISGEAVARMRPGSVIVDLAAERGGNCEFTRPDEVLTVHGVTILGPTNLAATVPHQASLMYARNLSSLMLHLLEGGLLEGTAMRLDPDDPIVSATLVCRDGVVVHPLVRAALDPGRTLPPSTSPP